MSSWFPLVSFFAFLFLSRFSRIRSSLFVFCLCLVCFFLDLHVWSRSRSSDFFSASFFFDLDARRQETNWRWVILWKNSGHGSKDCGAIITHFTKALTALLKIPRALNLIVKERAARSIEHDQPTKRPHWPSRGEQNKFRVVNPALRALGLLRIV